MTGDLAGDGEEAACSSVLFSMIVGPVLLIVLVVPLVRWLSDSRDSPSVHLCSPREILDERFAKGEIEREDYEARRKALGA
jgi:putative membrane protein